MDAFFHFCLGGGDPQAPETRRRCGVLSGGTGIGLNLLLFLGKLLAGVTTASIAITADAFNNLTDAASSIVTLVGFRLAGQEADEEHPFGHGRMEYLAGLAVSALILLVGVELAKSSLTKIIHPEPVDFSVLSAVILAVSVAVKLWMFWFNRGLSRAIQSAALSATAADSLSDAVATTTLLLGLLAGHFFSLPLDGWLGLAVAVFILRAGWSAARDTIDPLLGAQPDPDVVADIEALILSHPPVLGIHDLVIHDYGPGRRMMSVHAEVPARSELVEVHDVIDHIERELGERFGLEAVIHLDPVEPEDPYTRRLLSLASQAARELDPAASIHDLRRTPEGAVSFDVVAPYDVALTDEEVRAALTRRLEELEPGLRPVIGVDRSHVL